MGWGWESAHYYNRLCVWCELEALSCLIHSDCNAEDLVACVFLSVWPYIRAVVTV